VLYCNQKKESKYPSRLSFIHPLLSILFYRFYFKKYRDIDKILWLNKENISFFPIYFFFSPLYNPLIPYYIQEVFL